jgi:plasmid stability protein
MATVQIKNVPPDVHQILRDRASKAGQSLQAYLLAQLEEQASKPTIKELFERIEHSGGSLSPARAAKLVREDRDARSR